MGSRAPVFTAIVAARLRNGNIHEHENEQLQTLKDSIAAEIKKKEAALDPKQMWPTFMQLRRELEQCQRLGFTDLPEYKHAMDTLHDLNLTIDHVNNELRKIDRSEVPVIRLFQQL